MSIIGFLIWLAVIGVIAWALVTFIPMPQGIKTVIIIVAVVIAVLIAASAFGIIDNLDMKVPHLGH